MTDARKPTVIKDFPGRAVEEHLRRTGALPSAVQYTSMDGNTLLEALGDDAAKWAAAFNQHASGFRVPFDQLAQFEL